MNVMNASAQTERGVIDTEVTADGVTLTLSVDELMIINNALNEVCNGIHIADSEFQTRMAVERDEARAVLHRINAAWRRAASERRKSQERR